MLRSVQIQRIGLQSMDNFIRTNCTQICATPPQQLSFCDPLPLWATRIQTVVQTKVCSLYNRIVRLVFVPNLGLIGTTKSTLDIVPGNGAAGCQNSLRHILLPRLFDEIGAILFAVPKRKVSRSKKRMKTTSQKKIPTKKNIIVDPRTNEVTLSHKLPFNWKDYLPKVN